MPDRSESRPIYEEFAPAPALVGLIACFWNFSIPLEAQSFQHAVIPDGTVSLVFIRKRRQDIRTLRICGPRATAWWVAVDPGDSFWGARLLPGAAGPLLGVSARALQNQVQPLAAAAPQLAGRMMEGLNDAASAKEGLRSMESGLVALASQAQRVDPVVQQAVARLFQTCGNTSIASLARTARISERQFRRRFCEAAGLTPKQFSRVVRVRYACIRISVEGSARLAAIAQEAGYADQAHLSREFAQVFGSRAGELSALIRGFEHGEFTGYGMSDSFKTESRITGIQCI